MPYNNGLPLPGLGGTEPQSAEIPELNLRFTMPPAELQAHVATLIAQGLYRARLPWLPGEKIVASDLEGVANFVIGGLMGMERSRADGKTH